MRAARSLAAALLLVVPVALVSAQGLGDVAARERAKRQKQAAGTAGAGKSFSNDDLEQGGSPDSKQKSTTPTPASSGEGSSTASESSSESSRRREPSEPAESPKESATAALEARVKALQDKLNPMSGSFIYGATGSGDANEELRVRSELQQAETELATARQAAAGASDRNRAPPPRSKRGTRRTPR